MISYVEACKSIEDNFIMEGEDIHVPSLLMPLMLKHDIFFNEDISYILSEYFQLNNDLIVAKV